MTDRTKGADRKRGLSRTLDLVLALNGTTEGLTIAEMVDILGQKRRSVERTREIVGEHFELIAALVPGETRKRWRIPDALPGHFTRPTVPELAALETCVAASRQRDSPFARSLASLCAKLHARFDDRHRARIDPDFDALSAALGTVVGPGPRVESAPETYPVVAHAIMAGRCVEFDYRSEESATTGPHRVVPYGIVEGPVSHLVGTLPENTVPAIFRLDRMESVRVSGETGGPPADFDLQAWLSESFSVRRETPYDVAIRILPHARDAALTWRFHATQVVAEDPDGPSGSLRVAFSAAGLREIAEHMFRWTGDVEILAPEALREEVRAMAAAALAACR